MSFDEGGLSVWLVSCYPRGASDTTAARICGYLVSWIAAQATLPIRPPHPPPAARVRPRIRQLLPPVMPLREMVGRRPVLIQGVRTMQLT